MPRLNMLKVVCLKDNILSMKLQGECTNFTFNVVSPHCDRYEELTLYASDGVVRIDFLPHSCPICFQISEKMDTNCACSCDCHKNKKYKQGGSLRSPPAAPVLYIYNM